MGRTNPLIPASLTPTAIGSAPLTGLRVPSNESSPKRARSSSLPVDTCPEAASIPTAIGRSKAEPSFLTSAGARFTVILRRGKRKPEFFMAAATLSLLSLTAPSGSPTVEKEGTWLERSTSTLTM